MDEGREALVGPSNRVDNLYGDRNFVWTCPSLDTYVKAVEYGGGLAGRSHTGGGQVRQGTDGQPVAPFIDNRTSGSGQDEKPVSRADRCDFSVEADVD
jgi:hypothetical protein